MSDSEDKEDSTPVSYSPRPKPQVKFEETSLFKILAVASFIMLSILTWGSSPIQKAIEAVDQKHELKAKAKVCDRVRAMKEVYAEYTAGAFLSGCMTEKRNFLVDLAKTEKEKEYIKEIFEKADSLEHDRYKDTCREWSSAYLRNGLLEELIMQDLYDTFQCLKTYNELKKLGEDL